MQDILQSLEFINILYSIERVIPQFLLIGDGI